jgi:MinD superfamily P-loop ATPase
MVTEPTPFGLFDLTMAVDMVRELDVPFAVVVNRDRDDFPDLDAYLDREGISVLMRIPDSVEIARLYSRGVHFVEEMPEWEERFRDLLVRVVAGGGAP